MKRNLALVLSIVMIIVCIIPMGGCGNENDKISNLMTEFEYACNSLDVDAILDCIHPDITNKIKAAMGLVGMFTGQDSDDMLEAISTAITGNGKVDAENFFSSIKIEEKEVNSNSSSGKVKANISYKIGTEEITTETTFICSKYNDKWYIKSLTL